MLGRHHLLLSVGSISPLLAPLFPVAPTVVLIAITGVAIGSLIPDADAEDAAVFHVEVRGIDRSNAKVLNTIGFLYPVFGYTTKYLIYKPTVRLYDLVFEDYTFEERHRGFLHSILGLVTATVLTGILMVPVLLYLKLFSLVGLAIFLVAYFVGAILHLLEDSCTKTGIQWHYPFRDWKIKGQISTSSRPVDMIYQRFFVLVLGGLTVATFFLSAGVTEVPAYAFSGLGLLAVGLLWLGFVRYAAKCDVHR